MGDYQPNPQKNMITFRYLQDTMSSETRANIIKSDIYDNSKLNSSL
jgi:hypothetical protein